ncbi:MAG: MerC domain-containing protein [Myxococcota bacterium]|nr:MerC domain-containing protein [Myxococcota bacterium]
MSVDWRWLDRGGSVLSVGCGLHCLAAPLLVLVAPWLAGERVELALGLTAIAVAAVTSWVGFARRGDLRAPLAVGVGAALLLGREPLAPEGSAAEVVVSVGAAACLVCAHVVNLRGARKACCDAAALE